MLACYKHSLKMSSINLNFTILTLLVLAISLMCLCLDLNIWSNTKRAKRPIPDRKMTI